MEKNVMKKVAVVGVRDGWSSEQLADEIEKKSGFRLLIDPSRIALELTAGKAYYNGTDLTSLDGLIVKKVGHAYSPKLLDRLDILRAISNGRLRIFSEPARIGSLLNRLSCTVSLAKAGIPLPPTVITEDEDEAVKAVERFGRSVLKPLYTSKARGMHVVEPGLECREIIQSYKASGNDIIYIQKMIDLPGQDLGLVFLGGKYLATYARVKTTDAWNTTTASGGRYKPHEPSRDVIILAEKAQQIFGLDFTCVDIAESAMGPVVFEVSAFGGFRGLKEGCGIDAAALYTDYVFKELGA
jgi:ATP-grasp enzyme of GAK system